jgi:catechol 2,3-dioxygenase-like lactoylglutathione lyase family enzyme
MQLRRVIVFVKDLPRMSEFYRDALGLRTVPGRGVDGWAELDAGAATIALHAIPAAIAARIAISAPPAAREDTPIKLVFEVDDLSAARAHLIAHGATMGEVRSWGACDGIDPEGNVFQIVPAAPR